MHPRKLLSWVYDNNGFRVNRYENNECEVVREDGREVTDVEAVLVMAWYWTHVGVREETPDV